MSMHNREKWGKILFEVAQVTEAKLAQSPKDRLLGISDLIEQSDLVIALWNVDGTDGLMSLVVKGREFYDPDYCGPKPHGLEVIACRSMRQALGFRSMWGDDAMATPLSYGPLRAGPAIGCEVTEHVVIDS